MILFYKKEKCIHRNVVYSYNVSVKTQKVLTNGIYCAIIIKRHEE